MSAPSAQTGTGNIASASSNSSASLTVNKPGNLADGDLLWAVPYFRNASATITAPSGWTIHKTEAGNGTFCFATKPVPTASSEPSSYTFSTSGGANRCVMAMGRITGALLSSPLDAVGATSPITGTASVVLPSVTAVRSQCLLLAIAINNTSSGTAATFTLDPAMTGTTQQTVNTGSNTSTIQVGQQALTSAGATGTRTPTMSPAASNSAGFLVTIAGPATGSASLSSTSSLTASAAVGYSAAASLSSASSLTATARGQLFTADASLSSTSSMSATPAADLVSVLVDGVWRKVTVYELVNGSWVQS